MKKLNALFIVFFLILIVTGSARAELHKWVDKNGVVHISDTPPEEVAPNEKAESITPSKSGLDANPHPPKKKTTLTQKLLNLFRKKPKNSTNPTVELYTTSWCPYCERARNFFRSKGIPFTEYDVEKDKSAAARKNRLDKRNGVPFAVINGRGLHGYSAEAYQRALEGHP